MEGDAMTVWSVELDSEVLELPPGMDPETDPMLRILEALEEIGADGPATSGVAPIGSISRRVSARFCVEAASLVDAMTAGYAVFDKAAEKAGLPLGAPICGEVQRFDLLEDENDRDFGPAAPHGVSG